MLDTKYQHHEVDVAIVGGGLAGLTAAVYLARAGLSVTVFEKARQPGGRARSRQRHGFTFNQGPHALYIGGAAKRILDELDIPYTGLEPKTDCSLTVRDNQLFPLPTAPMTLLKTPLLGWADKVRFGRLISAIVRTDPQRVMDVSLQDWVNGQTRRQAVQQFALLLGRLSTYTNAPDLLSAGIVLQQIQMSLKETVLYLDGGWQTLVDGLQQAVEAAGGRVTVGERVTQVIDHEIKPELHLADGRIIAANRVILAVDPQTAAALVPHNQSLAQWAESAIPARAAVLDVALSKLPQPDNLIAISLDQPLYYSVHSDAAKLGPPDGALIHLVKYLPPTPTDAPTDKAELLALLDLVQPGWRKFLIDQRFLPDMTVITRIATAQEGGLPGRPGTVLPESHHLYLAGDWVGEEGWLADASLASAKNAVETILRASAGVRQEERILA